MRYSKIWLYELKFCMKATRLFFHAFAIASFLVTVTTHVAADDYPSKPITIVVPYAPGGGGDTFTRAIAVQAQEILNTKIFVENRTGGGATIGVGSVARAKSDGYTLGFVSSSPVVVVPNFFNVPYDPSTDITYLSRFIVSAYPVLVRTDSQFNTFQDLIAYGQANPGKLRWSTAGINGAPHIATEAALQTESIKSAFVPMQGSTEVLAALLGGTLDMGVMSDYAGPVAADDLRILAEIGPEPIVELPDIPTYKQLNYPLAPTIFFGLSGPAGLPKNVIATWDDTMRTITSSEQFQKVAVRLNGNVAFLGHEEFEALVLRDIEDMRAALNSLDMLK
jgi:tripartite-type tricarboxylate transporter receptor subunit TctC